MKSIISKFNRIAVIIISSIILVACEIVDNGGSDDHVPNPVISVIPGDSPLYVGMEVTLSAADSSDQDGDQLSYAWSQPQDQAIALTPSSADTSAASNVSVSFIASAAGTYTFILTVSDGKYEVSTEVTLDIVVDDSNEAPAFTSSSDPLSVAENSSGVIHTATASDADNDALTYSLSGSDADDFSIDASSGALSFASAPNFEAPSDANSDNVYELSLRASDGRAIVSQDLTVTVTDVNEAPSFTSSSTASAAENNSGTVYTATASDVDASDTLSYSLVGGADLKLFALNATELSFVEAPDYESATDSDGDNVYAVQLRVTDSAGLSQDLALSITVTDVNEAPSFTSGTSTSVSENTSGTVYTATASDVDASDTQTYSLVGGADQALFNLNGADLSFNVSPDYESAADSNGDNTYEVQLRVTDSGDLSTDLSLSINVTDVNEAPSFTSAPASTNAAENTSGTVYTATAQDPEDVLLVFTISGTDADTFSISTTTSTQAEIAFSTPPNFEAPADSDGDNVYELTLQVTDGSTAPISQAISISVTNVNEFDASFGSEPDADSATNQIAENATAGTAVGITASASDSDAGTSISYAFKDINSASANLFSIDASSGIVTLTNSNSLDFESASSHELVIVAASSDGSAATHTFTVAVTDINEAPTIANSATAVSFTEGGSGTVYDAAASDPENATLSYSLSGDDFSAFTISAEGLVTFNSVPDYDSATDADGNNVYAITIEVSDATNTTSQAITVTVIDLDEAPSITNTATSTSVAENSTGTVFDASATDPENATLNYSLAGADADALSIDSSGLISFNIAPDYDNPIDANSDNVYSITIEVADATTTVSQALAITVTNINEHATSTPADADASPDQISESATAGSAVGITAAATDADRDDSVSYSFADGSLTSGFFTIDSATGVVTLTADNSLDFESAQQHGLTIKATSSDGSSASDTFTVAVTDHDEYDVQFAAETDADANANEIAENVSVTTAVGITAAASDQDGSNNSVSYSFANDSTTDASGLFDIDASSGVVSFNASSVIDYETDAQSYSLNIKATSADGSSATHTFTVAVTDINEAPTIANSATAVSFTEGGSGTVYDAAASDPENATLSYSLSGDDFSAFTISAEGIVTFNSVPDYDSAADADGNNIYAITIEVSDGTNATTQAITVTIIDLDEAPSITNTATSASVTENSTGTVFDASATDPENATLNYSLAGADADALSIDSSGLISFNIAPDYDNPIDANSDNVYSITIEVADATTTVSQALAISVTNINEHAASAPTDADANADQIAENATAGTTVGITAAAADADRDDSVSYSFADGSLTSGFFSIDSATGVVTLTADNSLDFESAQQHGLTIKATSSDGSSASDTFTVAVTDHDEYDVEFAAEPDADANANQVAENVSAATAVGITAAASDQDGSNNSVSYSFANDSTTDASGLFDIDASSGVVSFNASSVLDYETDAQSYSLNIKATSTDGSSATKSFSVALTNVDEAPVFASSVSEVSFAENLATDTAVYDASATDPEGATTTYSLAGADAARLSIDSSGIITFSNSPDYDYPADADANNIYQITIVASDGSITASQELAISITNVNESPEFASTSAAVDAPENSAAAFYTASADDQDADTSMTYTLYGGADVDFFDLDASSGSLSFKQAQDREAAANDADLDYTYAVEIAASDGEFNAPTNLTLAITLTNVNEAPTVTNTVQEVSVLEATANSSANFAYTITATDPESDLLTFTLGGDDASAFDINSGTGAISFKAGSSGTGSDPDYDTPVDADGNNVYELALQAQDSSGDTSDPVALQVTVLNVSSAPNFLDSSGNSLATTIGGSEFADSLTLTENATGVIYTAITVDDDGVADFSGYSVSGGADAAAFSVDSLSGELSFDTAPDYESPHDSDEDNIYVVQVTAADTDESTMIELSITVTNLNDSAPTIAAQSLGINEDAADGSEVGAVIVSDADDPATTYSAWTITSGNTGSAFAIDADGLITVADTSQIDYESGTTSYSLDVSVSDGDNTGSGTVTININDTNDEAPIVASSLAFSIAEGSADTTEVGTATATDADAGTTFQSWSITGGNTNTAFAINPSSGVITVANAAELDYEGTNTYSLLVTVSDGDNTSAEQTITVTITDVNDEVPVITANQSFSTSEASPDTTVVGTVLATDPDGDGTGTSFQDWTITGGTSTTAFDIDSSTGALSVANASELDYSSGPTSYTLNLTVSDGSNTSAEQSITITIEENIIPADFAATGGIAKVTLGWSEAADTTYDIYRSSDANCDVSVFYSSACADGQLYNSATSGMEDTGLATEATYYYWLQVTRTNPAPTITQASLAPISATTTAMGVLNDTGMYYAGNKDRLGNQTDCSIGTNTPENQDCHNGRDVTHPDSSDGYYGFSFTKLDSSGAELAASAGSWSCVLDNVTGLIWEVKTDDGGLRDKDNTYKWGGITAIGRDHESREGDYYDDWNTLVDAANMENGTGLCGYTDWRVANVSELFSLADYGYYIRSTSGPSIDQNYFPNTVANSYISATPDALDNSRARHFNFYYTGDVGSLPRDSQYHVRLVRSDN